MEMVALWRSCAFCQTEQIASPHHRHKARGPLGARGGSAVDLEEKRYMWGTTPVRATSTVDF